MSTRAWAMTGWAAGLLLTGCTDAAGPGAGRSAIEIVGGDQQEGMPGSLLPQPLEVRVLNGAGHPAVGVTVEWAPRPDGAVYPARSATDDRGRAQTLWMLGPTAGGAAVQARVADALTSEFHATSIASRPDEALPFDVVIPLGFQTFDRSGQVVHPDVARTPAGLMGFPGHLAITPYPGGDASFELPSVFAMDGALPWRLEANAPNPVVLKDQGYSSDPDLVFVPESGELWLYYRQVTSENVIYVRRSRDAVQWQPAEIVVAAPNHRIISPAVVHRAPGDWRMWAVNGGDVGCAATSTSVELRTSADGLRWSPPQVVNLETPAGLFPWHIDVQWIPSRQEYWALYNAKQPGGCTTPAVFLATSPDGVTWHTVGVPVLVKGAIPPFQDIVYRSSFEYDPATDEVRLWFSGARWDGTSYVWSGAVERRHREALWAGDLPGGAELRLDFGAAPAPLTDWP